MLMLRRVGTVLVGAYVGGWIGRILLDWMLGVDGTVLSVAVLVCSAIGGLAAVSPARELKPLPPDEQRDMIFGWGWLLGGCVALGCLVAIAFPWGLAACVAVALATHVLLRRIT